LISEVDPDDPDRLFGLCDLGLGFPEIGYVSLAEITALKGPLGLPVERDRHFVADRPLADLLRILLLLLQNGLKPGCRNVLPFGLVVLEDLNGLADRFFSYFCHAIL
jgi:Protein of unknown function (DUF2958)